MEFDSPENEERPTGAEQMQEMMDANQPTPQKFEVVVEGEGQISAANESEEWKEVEEHVSPEQASPPSRPSDVHEKELAAEGGEEDEDEEEEEKLANTDEYGMGPHEDRISSIKETVSIEDFETVRMLGKGAYGRVNLVKCTINEELYALKVVDKELVASKGKIESVMREKANMFELKEHPNICTLEMTFKND